MRHKALVLAAAVLAGTVPTVRGPAHAQGQAQMPLAAQLAGADASQAAPAGPLEAAARAIAKGEHRQALNLLSALIDDASLTNDRRATALTDRGVVHTRLANPRAAIADFNKAVQLYPENPTIYNNRGVTLLGLGFTDEAIKDFDRAVLLAPGYLAALSNRASAHMRLGRTGDALRDLTVAIRIAGAGAGETGLATARALVYLAEHRPYAALRDLDHALGADTRSAEAYRLRARARLALGANAEALEDLSRAIAFEAQNADAFRMRGQAFLMSRNATAAIKDFTSVIELAPASAAGYLERGHAHILADAFREAEADLARALTLEPSSAIAYAYRAMMLKKMGQAELGAVEIDKAVKLAPDDAVVLWARGEIEEAMGRTDMALKSFEAAVARDPELKMARFGLERVDGRGAGVTEMPALGGQGWTVAATRTGYVATSPAFPKLRVPLEMAGDGEPRILAFEQREGTLKGIGVLRYHAGNRAGEDGGGEVEYAAVVDTRTMVLAALLPVRDGQRASQWEWTETGAKIDAVDGLVTTLVLRDGESERAATLASAQAAQQRQAGQRRPSSSGGVPSWAPWSNDGRGNDGGERRAERRQGSRPPRTLFELLTGN